MADFRPTKLDVERLSDRVTTIEHYLVSTAPNSPTPPASPEIAVLRRSLLRARNAFRRIGNGSFALSGFAFVAFLAALIDGKLTLLPAFIIVTAALFLGVVGLLFHLQADSIDPGDINA